MLNAEVHRNPATFERIFCAALVTTAGANSMEEIKKKNSVLSVHLNAKWCINSLVHNRFIVTKALTFRDDTISVCLHAKTLRSAVVRLCLNDELIKLRESEKKVN